LKSVRRALGKDAGRFDRAKRQYSLGINHGGTAARYEDTDSRRRSSGNRSHSGSETAIGHGADCRADTCACPDHGGIITCRRSAAVLDELASDGKLLSIDEADLDQLDSHPRLALHSSALLHFSDAADNGLSSASDNQALDDKGLNESSREGVAGAAMFARKLLIDAGFDPGSRGKHQLRGDSRPGGGFIEATPAAAGRRCLLLSLRFSGALGLGRWSLWRRTLRRKRQSERQGWQAGYYVTCHGQGPLARISNNFAANS
jgi:hypothetical protein